MRGEVVSRPVDYGEFGRRFVEQVVTSDRLRVSLEAMVAGEIETSVRMVGGLVSATGTGGVRRVEVDRILPEDPGEPGSSRLDYRALVDVDLDVVVKISGVSHRYEGFARIALLLSAVPREDLTILVEAPDVSEENVVLELRPKGRMAGVIDQLGGVADQVREQIVRFVNAQKNEPSAVAERVIDVKPTIESEWERRRPK